MMFRTKLGIAALAIVLLATACGNGDGSSGGGKASGPVTSIDGVQSAVVQIIANGSFVEPSESIMQAETFEGKSSGSGFIIDPSGIVVTNNHVVSGNASLEVFVDGRNKPVSAKVLGVSECSDLAVIKLEGDGYPYLKWSDNPVKVGQEVRAAGFPLGHPEFTLTSGIISKAEADGDTNWASVDHVIEHDANIQPGNSGGPLVDAKTGEVIAVNYAGGDVGQTGTSQFFAISGDLALPTVEQLKNGDVDSLGVNGRAINDPESGITGIWVSGVDTNSPAGELGLAGGDIIERIEGLTLGTDGTMSDYCKILRSRENTDKLAVQVLRFAEGLRLKGEFNGRELEPMQSLGTQVEDQTGPVASGGADYSEFVRVSDNSNFVSVEVPSQWSVVSGSPFPVDSGSQWPMVVATTDSNAYDNWAAPGVTIIAAPGDEVQMTAAQVMNQMVPDMLDECDDAGQDDYNDGLYQGRVQYLSDCGGTNSAGVLVTATPADGSFLVIVGVQIMSEADLAALDRIIATFSIND